MNVKNITKASLVLVIMLMLTTLQTSAQNYVKPKTRILFLLDGSGSMYAAMDKDVRINVAKRMLSKIVDSLEHAKEVQVALRVYGHQFSVAAGNRSCEDTKLEVPFANNNFNKIKIKF